MVGGHHGLNGQVFEQTLGDSEGEGSLVCCSSQGHKKSDMTQQLHNFYWAQRKNLPYCFLRERFKNCSSMDPVCQYRPILNYQLLYWHAIMYLANMYFYVKVKVTQSCPTLCNPRDYSLPGFSVHGILQARILGYHFLLQGIFLTQGANPGLLHCRWILYHLSYQGSLVLSKLSVSKEEYIY